MARTLVYERGVFSLVADTNLYEKLNSLENKTKIKEEPPDSDAENTNNNESTLAEEEAVTNTCNQTARPDITSTSPFSNKENECQSVKRSQVKRKRKRDEYRKRRRVKRTNYVHSKEENQHVDELRYTETNEKKSKEGAEHSRYSRKRKRSINLETSRQSQRHKQNAEQHSSKKPTHCDICFVKIRSELEKHYQRMTEDISLICKKCKVSYSDKRSYIHHIGKCVGVAVNRRLYCNFCDKIFIARSQLQSHLFHMHSNEIYQTSPVKTDMKSPKRTSTPRVISTERIPSSRHSYGGKTSVEDFSEGKISSQASNNTKCDTSIGSNSVESHSPTKKMRQTTLTEFLKVTDKKQKDETPSPQKDHIARPNSVSDTGDKESPTRSVKPLVQIHADTELMMKLLNESGIKEEPEDEEVEREMSRQNTPYSLRPTRPTVYTPDTFYYLDNVPKRKNRYSLQERQDTPVSRSSRTRKRTSSLIDYEIKAKFNIKECFVRLVRYDSIPKQSDEVGPMNNRQVTTLLRSPSTKVHVSANDTSSESSSVNLKQPQVPLSILNSVYVSNISENEAEEKYDSKKVNVDPEIKPFTCKICKKMFSSKRNLYEHHELFHVAYISSICNARYTSKYKLLHHYLRQHMIFKKTVCCVCKETFENRSLLQRHMLLHCIRVLRTKHDRFPVDVIMKCNAFQKNHVCNGCGKRFWLSSCLKQHENVCLKHAQSRAGKSTSTERSSSNITPKTRESNLDNKSTTSNVPKSRHSLKTCRPSQESSEEDVGYTLRRKRSRRLLTSDDEVTSSASTIFEIEHHQLRKRPNINYEIYSDLSDTDIESTQKEDPATKVIASKSQQEISTPDTCACPVCDMKFESVERLSAHKRTYERGLTHRCTICTLSFPNKRLLHQHTNGTHTPVSQLQKYRYNCKFCSQGFVSANQHMAHEKHLHTSQITVIPEQTWLSEEQVWYVNTVCNTCNIVFENHDRFVEHNMYYYKGQSFTCNFCGQSFRGLYMLHHHSKLVHYPESARRSYSFVCDICNEGFTQDFHFHAHKLHVHENGGSKSSSGWSDHQQQETAATLQRTTASTIELGQSVFATYSCNICQMFFTKEDDLTAHEIEYSLTGDYLCNGCEKRCRTLSILRQHYALNHVGEDVSATYKCKQCMEVFTAASSLTCHQKHVHPEESNQRYELIANLEKNVDKALELQKSETANPTTERGPRNFQCLTCGTDFVKDTDLKNHLFEYSNIGEYSCAVCHRKFAESSRFAEHKLKHSRVNTILAVHHCPICQEGFSDTASVKNHVMHLHGNETFQTLLTKCGSSSNRPNDERSNNTNQDTNLAAVASDNQPSIIADNTSNPTVETSPDVVIVERPNSVQNKTVEEERTENVKNKTAEEERIKSADSESLVEKRIENVENNLETAVEEGVDKMNSNLETGVKKASASVENNLETVVEERTDSVEPNLESVAEEGPNRVNENTTMVVGTKEATLTTPDIVSEDRVESDSDVVEIEQLRKERKAIAPVKFNVVPALPKVAGSPAEYILPSRSPKSSQYEEYKCYECSFKFRSHKALEKHIIRYSNHGDFLCDRCSRRFPEESIFNEHVYKHVAGNSIVLRYACQFCGERFRTLKEGQSHMIHLHKKKSPLKDQRSTSADSTLHTDDYQSSGIEESQVSMLPVTATHAPEVDSSVEPVTTIHTIAEETQSTETDPDITIVTPTEIVPSIEEKRIPEDSRSLQAGHRCPFCFMFFENITAYNSHCESEHPYTSLAAQTSNSSNTVSTSDVSLSLAKCSECKLAFSDEQALQKHFDNTHFQEPSVSNNCVIDIEDDNTSDTVHSSTDVNDELKIIWEKPSAVKASPKSWQSVTSKIEPVSSPIDEMIPPTENKTVPRLKVRPFAKIIETLTIQNQTTAPTNVRSQIPQRAQVIVTEAHTSQRTNNTNAMVSNAGQWVSTSNHMKSASNPIFP